MTRSAANPQEMREYLSLTNGSREDAYTARDQLITAYEAFVAAVPEGIDVPERPDIAGPLGRSRDVDTYTGTVADQFETAGAAGDGGVFTLDPSLLTSIPYTSRYSEQRRQQLRQKAEEELAQLRQVMSAGTSETTMGELVAVVGWMRFEIDRAATPEARQQVAEDLIDTMGAGDLQAIFNLLDGDLDDGGDADRVRSVLGDLGVVVSLGLEGNPGRANRWAGTISQNHDWYHDGPPEMLVALGALTAPGTSTLGKAVWREVWNHTYVDTDQGTGFAGGHMGQDGGPLDQMFGTRNAIEVLADSASRRPDLANDIVRFMANQGVEDFEHLFAQGGTQNPPIGDESTYDALGRMLTASVDLSLDLEDRITAARRTMEMYDTALQDSVDYVYAGPIREALGTMTQPLLANLTPEGDQIRLPGNPPDASSNPSVAHLKGVIEDLAKTEEGVAGLATAFEGASTELIFQAADRATTAGSQNPLHDDTLGRVGAMMDWVTATVTEERIDALVSAVEGGGLEQGLYTAIVEGLGASPMEPVAAVIETVNAAAGQEVVSDGSVLGGDPEIRLTYNLVLANLAARPDAYSPRLVEALQQAAEPSDPGAEGGQAGIYDFLHDDTLYEPDYPGLAELRAHILHQEDVISPEAAVLLSEVFGLG